MEKQDKPIKLSHRDYLAYWKMVFCEASGLVWGNVWMKAAILAVGIFVFGLLFFGILLSRNVVQFENPIQSVLANSVFQIIRRYPK